MVTHFCPECHQPMAEVVAGVRLTALKARLFRYIETHPHQSSAEIAAHFYGRARGDPALTVRSHIYQINDALMNTPLRIRGGQWIGFYVDKGKQHAA